jgi:uncharacterized protein YneF (UPF0154 family)
MNSITREMRSVFRIPLRSGAIILMLAISIGLILAMLVARSSVDAKVAEQPPLSSPSIRPVSAMVWAVATRSYLIRLR